MVGSGQVAPHAGAWIETAGRPLVVSEKKTSRLTQARGLKLPATSRPPGCANVAPHAGAWIETVATRVTAVVSARRASRRRVD